MTATSEENPESVPLRPAATVMLIRDHPLDGLEVFMLQRTLKAAFASGMYVFPGGRVDDVDNGNSLEALCDGRSDGDASALLGLSRGGLAYWVAAIRECFEEAGVLLARRVGEPDPIDFDEHEIQARFARARDAVNDGSLQFVDLIRAEGLRLATDSIHYVSHWITPIGESRRFDTRFFVAPAPSRQEPLHDDGETIDSLWVTPADALQRHREGKLAMIPPTISNLEFLLPHDDVNSALQAAQRVGIPPSITPRLRIGEHGKVIGVILPGDPDY